MIVVGCDPGKKGGMAVIGHQGWSQPTVVLSVVDGLDWLLQEPWEDPRDVHVFLEKAQAMPGQGVTSMFNYGVGFGEILGVLKALALPHTLVPPATWMRVMHAGTKAGDSKARSLEAARRLFPGETWMVGKQKKPQDGLFESALLAEYGRRQLQGGGAP